MTDSTKLAGLRGSRSGGCLTLLTICLLLLSACASLTSREVYRDVFARQVLPIKLGAIIDLLPGPVDVSAILLRADGTAAVVAVDSSQRIHYLAVTVSGVVEREILGMAGQDMPLRVDVIEHRGQIRVLAGDKQFTRAASASAWQETGSNRCAKFLPFGDSLFCAMVIKGAEIKSPQRKDWTVGWFILFPIVFWSNETAAKLVIAEESSAGWLVRAVVDGESPLDADADFFAAADSTGQLQLLFSASRGGGLFGVFVGPAPGAAAAGHSGFTPELRYAGFSLRELSASADHSASGETSAQAKSWLSRSSVRVEDAPTVVPGDRVHPIYRRFSSTSVPGALDGLLWERYMPKPKDSTAWSDDAIGGWLRARLANGGWSPPMEIVAVSDLPDERFSWSLDDRFAVTVSGAAGGTHALLASCAIGFWESTCHLAYFVRSMNQWSAPLHLGSSKFNADGRALAVGTRGCSLATWVDAAGKFVGRWIGPCTVAN